MYLGLMAMLTGGRPVGGPYASDVEHSCRVETPSLLSHGRLSCWVMRVGSTITRVRSDSIITRHFRRLETASDASPRQRSETNGARHATRAMRRGTRTPGTGRRVTRAAPRDTSRRGHVTDPHVATVCGGETNRVLIVRQVRYTHPVDVNS